MTRYLGFRSTVTRVSPRGFPRVPDTHLRLGGHAVFQSHELNLPRDFLLPFLSLLLRQRRGSRGGDLALIEVPQRHRVPRGTCGQNLVGYPRVRLEQHQTSPERRHVRQSHRLLRPVPAQRRHVPHALGHVHGWHAIVHRLAFSHPGVEAVDGLEAPAVAVDEPGGVSAEAPKHAELAAVALLPLGVQVQQRGQESAVPVGVVHVSHVPRVVARVDGAHRLGPGGYRRELGAAEGAEFVDQGVRALHGGGQGAPLHARGQALGAVEPPDVVTPHVPHGVLRRVTGFTPREDARREVAVLVGALDLVAQRSGVRAREEAVDDHEVLGLQPGVDLREAVVHQPPPLRLVQQRVLGAQEEQLVAPGGILALLRRWVPTRRGLLLAPHGSRHEVGIRPTRVPRTDHRRGESATSTELEPERH